MPQVGMLVGTLVQLMAPLCHNFLGPQ